MLTHFNVVMQTVNSMIEQGISGYGHVWYANLPLFHIGGLVGILPYVMAWRGPPPTQAPSDR